MLLMHMYMYSIYVISFLVFRCSQPPPGAAMYITCVCQMHQAMDTVFILRSLHTNSAPASYQMSKDLRSESIHNHQLENHNTGRNVAYIGTAIFF